MIGKLRGRIDEIGEESLILDVGGVGYLVQTPARTLRHLPEPGGDATLFIETVVREDAIRLYGFQTAEEKSWFQTLQDVQGVGARVALAVLGTLDIDELTAAIAALDHVPVARAHGVGPKLAKRIVAELKEKAPALAAQPIRIKTDAPPAKAVSRADAISALINLGYPSAQAAGAVDRTLKSLGADAPVEDLIREGLKALS
jgi:Holliday junction DNA helicase RuvA